MKKSLVKIFVCFFCVITIMSSTGWAQSSQSNADRQTIINTFTDFFATIGKTVHQKRRIIRKRKTWRRNYRLEKERIRKDAVTKRQIKKQQKIILDKIRAKNQN